MKFLYLAIVLVFDVAVADLDVCEQENPPYNPELDLQWKAYIDNYKKEYSIETTNRYRRCVWEINLADINQHNNAGGKTYTMAVNQFTDMTFNEYTAFHQMNIKRPTVKTPSINVRDVRDADSLLDSIDLRENNYVNPVQNKGDCGSCWAFSATGAMEGQIARKTKTLVKLSEQQLVDCSTNGINNGCKSGDPKDAFEYVISNGGIYKEEDYPYTAEEGKCKKPEKNIVAEVTEIINVESGESSLKKAVANNGPVSVSMVVTNDFKNYDKGIFVDETCQKKKKKIALLVVGYTPDYWIVRNCQGSNWGIDGYIHIVKGRNMCGIADNAVYPITKESAKDCATTSTKQPYVYVSFLFVAKFLNFMF